MNTKYHQTESFKFPAAGLIGLDAGTKASVSKFLRARERELNTIETVFIMCINGPFHGQSIELQPTGESGAHRSAEFTVGAWRGYYEGSKWVSTLEADAPAPEAMAAPLPRPQIACDLPAKGFNQLRDLLGEMSINPLERETTIKTRYKTARFEYGRTDDFGNHILEFSPVGAYRLDLIAPINTKRSKKAAPIIAYKITRSTSFQQGAMAMDDFGELFITQPRKNEREEMTEKRQFTTYKLGRTSYTIPATIEAVERLAAKILKIKKWHADKMLSLAGPVRVAAAAQPAAQAQPEPVAIVPTPEPQTAAIVEPELNHIDNRRHRIITNNPIAGLVFGEAAFTPEGVQINPRKTDTPPALLPKIEQPAKPLATTCNPDALRLRSKATMCRAANRPTWAERLEAQADALERIEPTEPPPGSKPKPAQGCQCDRPRKTRPQRPRKTACILLAKIRHPVRQKFRPPPGIKTVTPSAKILQTDSRSTERPTPCHAHNLNHATHPPHPSKLKQSAVIYPCPQRPNFAASAPRHGKHGKLVDTACQHRFGGSSTSYWLTLSCRTKTKALDFSSVQTG